MSTSTEEDRDSDAAPIHPFSNLRIVRGGQRKESDILSGQTAVLPCGHKMPPDCLISWCRYYIKQKKTEFTCPRFDEYKKGVCGTKFSYQDLCHTALLTPSLKEFFEEKLGELTAARICDFKACPGCQSYVVRADQGNLCVQCIVCTAKMGCPYVFCWNCRRKWKGAAQNAVRCGYSVCRDSETSQVKPDLLKLSEPEFRLKLQTEEIYVTMDKSSDRNRLAMIINNVEFRKTEYNRRGAEKDEESMRTLLDALGYDAIILNDLSAAGMEAALRDFSQRNEHRHSDSTFFIMMSHGGPDGIHGINYDENKEDVFPVDRIFHHLNSENCPGLIDKPKIILIQACRGDKDGHVWEYDCVRDNKKGKKQHREKDFACFRSCTPDTVSIRSPLNGSIFIQNLVNIFNKHAHEDDIMEMFRKIILWFDKAAKEDNFPYQIPSLDRTTLGKKFYLFPGL